MNIILNHFSDFGALGGVQTYLVSLKKESKNNIFLWSYKTPLKMHDLMKLPHNDHVSGLVKSLEGALAKTDGKGFLGMPRVLVALFKARSSQLWIILFFCITEGLIRIASPALLFNLVEGLQERTHGDDFTGVYIIAGILGVLAIVQTFVHHILFFMTMRVGWQWKASVIALLYQNLFNLF